MKVQIEATFRVVDAELVRKKAHEMYEKFWGDPLDNLEHLEDCVKELALHSNDGTYGYLDVGLEILEDSTMLVYEAGDDVPNE